MINVQRNIKVLYVEPFKEPVEMFIKNNLQEKRRLVDGNIEYAYLLNDYSISIICNEEGKINGMKPNRDIGHDIIFGPFVIAGYDDSGEDRSLTDEQINKYKKEFDELSIYKTMCKINQILISKKNKNELEM